MSLTDRAWLGVADSRLSQFRAPQDTLVKSNFVPTLFSILSPRIALSFFFWMDSWPLVITFPEGLPDAGPSVSGRTVGLSVSGWTVGPSNSGRTIGPSVSGKTVGPSVFGGTLGPSVSGRMVVAFMEGRLVRLWKDGWSVCGRTVCLIFV